MLICLFLIDSIASGFNMGATASLLPEIAEELTLTHTQIGVIWAAPPLAMMLFSLIGGSLGDRIGVKRLITLALIWEAIFAGARALLPSFWWLSATMFCWGISEACIIPNLHKAVGDWFDQAEMGRANGLLIGGPIFGIAIGSMLGASILSPILRGWKGVMWLTGGITLVVLIIWIILAKEQQLTVPPKKVSLLKGLKVVFKIKNIWLLAIIESCIIGGYLSWIGMFPDILVSREVSPGVAGLYTSILTWTVLVTTIIGTYTSDRLGIRKPFMWPLLIVAGVSFSLQGFFIGAPLVYILVLTGLVSGTAVGLPRAIALETEGVRPQLGGSAIGLMFTLNRLGALTWPILMGALMDYTGLYWTPLVLVGLLFFISAGVSFFLKETGAKARHESILY